MKRLEIEVSEDVAANLEKAARTKGLSLDEFIRVSLEERLARDAEFEKAARHVLAKNAELYDRLS